jgi:hypothetical protein
VRPLANITAYPSNPKKAKQKMQEMGIKIPAKTIIHAVLDRYGLVER